MELELMKLLTTVSVFTVSCSKCGLRKDTLNQAKKNKNKFSVDDIEIFITMNYEDNYVVFKNANTS